MTVGMYVCMTMHAYYYREKRCFHGENDTLLMEY